MNALLIRGARMYRPEACTGEDVLVVGAKIVAVGPELRFAAAGVDIQEFDARDLSVIPGFIDSHLHIAGAGSTGAGPISREPDFGPTEILCSGITTVIGCPGADWATRSLSNLLQKARSLEAEGLTTHIWTNGYGNPPITLTGSITTDILYCEKVAGAKVAMFDFMAPPWTADQLHDVTWQVLNGSSVAGKAGVIHLHIGVLPPRLALVREVVDRYRFGDLHWSARHGGDDASVAGHFQVTHANWSRALLDEALRFAADGGRIDFTAGLTPETGFASALPPADALNEALAAGVDVRRVTVSSDSGGNESKLGHDGRVAHVLRLRPPRILDVFQDMVCRAGVAPDVAVRVTSTNAADLHRWYSKGRIAPAADADLLFFDRDWSLRHVMTMGTARVWDGKPVDVGIMEKLDGRQAAEERLLSHRAIGAMTRTP